MLISGFTFLRNAHKLYYPVLESIQSILPIVDEFVIAIGKGDDDDITVDIVKSLNNHKVKIIHTTWDVNTYKDGTIYAHQTDVAKKHCKGKWLFYLQSDEVIHEKYLGIIKAACQKNHLNLKVEGFVFNYHHFYGDYKHYFADHCWYRREIRIIRNLPEIHSWRDAQSFRYYESAHTSYKSMVGSRKLNCLKVQATVYHYGWVRPPAVMKLKNDRANATYGKDKNQNIQEEYFDYGRLDRTKQFNGTHPNVMLARLQMLDWEHLLRFDGPTCINRLPQKHERLKYRILSWIEDKVLGGREIGGFNNFRLIEP